MRIVYLGRVNLTAKILKDASLESEATFEVVESIESLNNNDLIFVDYENIDKLPEDIDSNRVVVLTSSSDKIANDFAFDTLKKPFLSGDVIDLIAKKSQLLYKSENVQTDILNPDEIEIVKSFLKEVESNSDDRVDIDKLYDMPSPKQLSYLLSADELIEVLKSVKPKKLRKILKGAKINISITFEKDNL